MLRRAPTVLFITPQDVARLDNQRARQALAALDAAERDKLRRRREQQQQQQHQQQQQQDRLQDMMIDEEGETDEGGLQQQQQRRTAEERIGLTRRRTGR